jgi:ABC-type dipeptide/oligopeptide/nickel transport system permease subunit
MGISDEAAVADLNCVAHGAWRDVIRCFTSNKLACLSLLAILLVALIAITAPLIAPHHPIYYQSLPTDSGGGGRQIPPLWQEGGNPKFILGTDLSGRDIVSRIMFGAHVSLVAGIVPALIAACIGLLIGLVSGYLGGAGNTIILRMIEVTNAFPDLLFAIFLLLILAPPGPPLREKPDGLLLIILAFALTGWVGIARVVRGQVLALKEKEFTNAAQESTLLPQRSILAHILPKIVGPAMVAATQVVPGFIIAEATLDFIGIGVRPPQPTWGSMAMDGYMSINTAPHVFWIPSLCITILALAFTVFGDGLKDAMDSG